VADDEHPFVFRLTRVKEIVLRQSLAGQNGGGIRNGVGCCDRRFGGDRIGVGAKAVQRGNRYKGGEKGQTEKFYGLEVLIHFYFGHGLMAANADISNNQVSSEQRLIFCLETKKNVACAAGRVLIQSQVFGKKTHVMSAPNPEVFSQKDKVTILLHEYNTLRQEILTRTTQGFQLLAICAALFVWIIQANLNWRFLIGLIAAMAILLIGSWITFNKITEISIRLLELEKDINTRAGEKLLVWETQHGDTVIGCLRRIMQRSANISPSGISEKETPLVDK
jgi:hypothetical protein